MTGPPELSPPRSPMDTHSTPANVHDTAEMFIRSWPCRHGIQGNNRGLAPMCVLVALRTAQPSQRRSDGSSGLGAAEVACRLLVVLVSRETVSVGEALSVDRVQRRPLRRRVSALGRS